MIGVDTHKHVHVAVALDPVGARLAEGSFAADRAGYRDLIAWAARLGDQLTFAIEDTGSYGSGLTSAVRRSGAGAVEVMRADRRDRRLRGKSDTLDTENAARAALASQATAIPKSADGVVEAQPLALLALCRRHPAAVRVPHTDHETAATGLPAGRTLAKP